MSVCSTRILSTIAGALILGLLNVEAASAVLLRRTFDLNATSPYQGSGFFEYDSATLAPTGDPSGNKFTPILSAIFRYTGKVDQSIVDPLSAVNFDSAGNFLGIDLELPAPVGQLNKVLIANENAYIANALFSNIVTYGAATPASTPIPTPALLPGLLALGWRTRRRQKAMKMGQVK
jgi:hypothetical protein